MHMAFSHLILCARIQFGWGLPDICDEGRTKRVEMVLPSAVFAQRVTCLPLIVCNTQLEATLSSSSVGITESSWLIEVGERGALRRIRSGWKNRANRSGKGRKNNNTRHFLQLSRSVSKCHPFFKWQNWSHSDTAFVVSSPTWPDGAKRRDHAT